MSLISLTSHIFYMPYDSISDRPNLIVVTDHNQTIAIDAGASETHVEAFYKLLDQHSIPLPETTVLTHWHWDHSFALPYIHGKSLAHVNTQKHLEHYSRFNWNEEIFKAEVEENPNIIETFIAATMRIEYPDITKIKVICADETFEEAQLLKAGNLQVHIIPTQSPHGDDNVLIHIPDEQVLVIGDAICCDFFKKNECDLKRLEILENTLRNLDFTIGLQGHCNPMTKEEIINQIKELKEDYE